MPFRFLVFTIVLFVLNCTAYSQKIEKRFQSILDSIYSANKDAVGLIAHVESPDKNLSWGGSAGFSDKEHKDELDKNQPALIASNIKTYVAATILRLVEMKKLSIDDPVKNLLTKKTQKLFEDGGYNLEAIKIKHLLSHTSGIQNYADAAYISFISENPKHRWTRDEQLERTIKTGKPFAEPEELFNYTDANYLLTTEIIEGITDKPFYTAMRELLGYKKLGLANTWIPTLEEKPTGTKELVHQYWSEYNWNSYEIDVSVDLYGGGGIACTAEELAKFNYKLFNEEVVKDPAILDLIFTEIKTKDLKENNYYLGLSSYEYQNQKAYGHGGFWGTIALYFPHLNTSISVYVLERDKKLLRDDIINLFIPLLNNYN